MMRGCLLCVMLLAGSAPFHAQVPDREAPDPAGQGDFVIGIEDVLFVSVWGEPELSVRVQVRPDGKVTIPLIHDLAAEGLTTLEVRKEIVTRLSRFVRDPNVTVILDQHNSFRVYVLGEVNQQGVLNFHRPTRLLQALAAAGGFTEFSKKSVTVLREQDGVEHRIRIDGKRLLGGEASQTNIFLEPGDTILVN